VAEDLALALKCCFWRPASSGSGAEHAKDAPEPVVIQIGNLKLDRAPPLRRGNEEVHLSPKELIPRVHGEERRRYPYSREAGARFGALSMEAS
jgi:hypothetical protein